MNSHITVPRLIYNEFTGENGYLYKYEIEKNVISKTSPKTTFTKENYYSNLMEKKLSIHVENPLKILEELKEFIHHQVIQEMMIMKQNFIIPIIIDQNLFMTHSDMISI